LVTPYYRAKDELGRIRKAFQEEVAKRGLYYPPDPASRGSCFIGGNLAENSGGPRAVKYGVTKDFVLNLEVVLADGSVIWTGANVLKNATGLNLTQLMIGSEGTLGIITKVVFRLLALPKYDRLLLAPFKKAEDACEAVAKIFHLGITPSALEFMERDALDFAQKYVPGLEIKIEEDIEAHLLIEVDGNDPEQLNQEAEKIYELINTYDCGEVLFAESEAEKDRLWKLRRSLGEAVKVNSIYKEEDTVVKRAELPILLKGVKEIGEKYGPFDIALMECGQYNEEWKYIHMMPEESAQGAVDLQARLAMPIHWGAFTLALHDWTDPVERFTAKAKELNLQTTTPRIGESILLNPGIFPEERWWLNYK
jgi:glycolate oxidase